MAKGILIDITKCMGCKACQVACKRWNDLPAERTKLSSDWTNPPDLSADTWTIVRFKFKWDTAKNTGVWRFVHVHCMHCLDPPCVHVCPVKAITKYPEGPVVIDTEAERRGWGTSKCIGCKYCIAACPFGIPRYDPAKNKVYKCWMCADRIKQGDQPACVGTCPTGALEFGDRDVLLEKARRKAKAINGYVYGDEDEIGGTSVIYVSDIPPTELGLPKFQKSFHQL